jgi:hypothetical protein
MNKLILCSNVFREAVVRFYGSQEILCVLQCLKVCFFTSKSLSLELTLCVEHNKINFFEDNSLAYFP